MFKPISILKQVLAAAVVMVASAGAFAADPILSFHTQVYNNAGPENAFHFYIGSTENTTIQVDCGFGKETIEVKPAVFDSSSSGIAGTLVLCSVSEAGTVKVYGDADLIDYLDLEGCYIDRLDFPKLTSLEILNLSHNLLPELDLTGYNELMAVYLSDNPFDVKPLIIGPDKPALSILEMNIIEGLDSSFTLTDYPSLQVFSAYHCATLTHVDPSGCPELLSLAVDVTPVRSIDVSKNPKLLILNVGDTFVDHVDVSANKALQQLYCSHTGEYAASARLTNLDVTNNPDLVYLFCAGNNLRELDITKNPNLITLSAYSNYLPGIDFSNCEGLREVDIHDNLMDYVTLPAPRSTFIDYYYSQKPFPTERSYAVGTELDFTAKVNRPETTTTGVLCYTNSYGASEPLDERYYTWNDGKITLNRAYADSVHVLFNNTLFPEYPLRSANFMVKSAEDYGKPSPLLTFSASTSVTDLDFSVGILGASAEAPVTFSVDFGNGELLDFTATSTELPAQPNVHGTRSGRVTIYIPEGRDISAFGIADVRITNMDISKAKTLQYLAVTGAGLSRLDMANNTLLREINLADNNFTTVDFDGNSDYIIKNYLDKINLSGNKFSTFILGGKYTEVDLSRNVLTSVTGLGGSQVIVNLADNQLADVDLSDCAALESLDLSGNQLTAIDLTGATALKTLNVANNKLVLGNFPADGAVENYIYAPQAKYVVPAKAPMIDLSELLYPALGSQTVFTWISETTGQPVAEDAVRFKKGVTYFEDASLGMVYCSVSNPAYSEFTGADAYVTTTVEVTEMPTTVCASFVTAATQTGTLVMTGIENGTTVYIDWTGDGDMVQYILADSYKLFPVSTKANTEVKVYAYDENNGLTVFSIDGIKLKSIDVSGLKQAIMFAAYDSDLEDGAFKLPDTDNLRELAIQGAKLTDIDLSAYPKLYSVNLSNNRLTSFDASVLPDLGNLFITYNYIESVTFDNENLWNIDLAVNRLENIDLSGAPFVSQLNLTENFLSSIDVAGLSQLRELHLGKNFFTFATLPAVSTRYYVYDYANQYPMNVKQTDGVVDLSAQAKVGGVETVFLWFSGVPEFDEEGNLIGDLLEDGGDYFIEDGVTRFYEPFTDIMCVMTNTAFPQLLLYTDLMDVVETGVADVAADSSVSARAEGSAIVVTAAADVPVAVYAVNGTQLARTATVGGTARIEGLEHGVYVVRAGTRVFKLAIR